MSTFIPFDSPVDFRFLSEGIKGLRLHNYDISDIQAAATWGKGSVVMSPDRPRWSDGTNWNEIFPFAATGVVQNTAVLRGVSGKVEFGLANGHVLIGNSSGISVEQNLSGFALNYFTGTVTGDISLNSYKITSLGTPSSASDAATKAYVDAIATGLRIRTQARAATTGNITLSGTQTIDGVAVIAGDVVLVKNQSTATQNGLYTVSAGAWTRHPDMDTSSDIRNSYVLVLEGTQNIGTSWVTDVPLTFTLGTDPIVWNQFSLPVLASEGNGLVKVGQTFHFATSSNYTQYELFFAATNTTIGRTGAAVNQQILIGKTSDAPAWATVGGDLSISAGNANFTIVNNAVTTAKINNAAVSNAKMANMVEARIKGRAVGNGTGAPQDLTAAEVRTLINVANGANNYSHPNHTGDVTSVGDGATTITPDAVTTTKIQDGAVTAAKIATNAVTTVTIQNDAVTDAKIASVGLKGLSALNTDGYARRVSGTWAIQATIDVAVLTGTLQVGNGGTGFSTYTAGDILYANATNSLAKRAIGSNNQVLQVSGGLPVYGLVDTANIANNAITTAKIGNSAVTTGTINDGAVTTDKIANSAVTFAKLQNSATDGLSVIGRSANSAGVFAEISAAQEHQVLRRSGSSIGFGSINLGQSNATTGTLPVNRGGTGLSSFTAGTIPVGNGTSPLHTSSSLVWDITNSRLGVAQANPAVAIHTSGSIRADSQLILPVTTGTAPMEVTSRTRVANLNVDQLDGADVGNLAPAGGVTTDGATVGGVYSEAPQNLGTNPFTIWTRFRVPESGTGRDVGNIVWNIASGSQGSAAGRSVWAAIDNTTTGNLVIRWYGDSTNDFIDARITNIYATFAGKVVDLVLTRSGNSVVAYIDGVPTALSLFYHLSNADVNQGAWETVYGEAFTLSINHRRFFVGLRGNASASKCRFHRAVLFNRALSAAEAASLTVNGVDPADQWGAQVNQITGAAINSSESDRQFSSFTASGTDGFTASYDATNGSNQAGFPIAANLVLGKRYRFRGVANTNSVAVQVTELTSGTLLDAPVLTSAITINTSSAAPFVKEFTWNGTDTITHVGFHTNASGRSGNLVVSGCAFERIGAVIDLDLGVGVGTTFPDRSSNNLTGVGSGDLVHLLPVKRTYANVFAQTLPNTSDSTFTVTHNLGTQDIIYSIRNPSNNQPVMASVVPISSTQAEVRFGSSVTGSNYRVVITGAA
jgi:hypothetical protein